MGKDYSLLRPFDLEAAKRGEPICCWDGSNRIYMTGPDNSNRLCVEDPANGLFVLAPVDRYRRAPLCWVEGKPVYKGDVLYGKWDGASPTGYVIGGVGDDGIPIHERNGFPLSDTLDAITWTPPKVKREGWVNIYPSSGLRECVAQTSHAYPSKKAADAVATGARTTCVRIEWEE